MADDPVLAVKGLNSNKGSLINHLYPPSVYTFQNRFETIIQTVGTYFSKHNSDITQTHWKLLHKT